VPICAVASSQETIALPRQQQYLRSGRLSVFIAELDIHPWWYESHRKSWIRMYLTGSWQGVNDLAVCTKGFSSRQKGRPQTSSANFLA